MKHLKTLRVRFALWTAGLLLAALTLFSTYVYIRMAQSLADSVDSALRLAVSQVVAEVDVANAGSVSINVSVDELLEDIPSTLLLEQGFSFRLLNGAGRTVQEYGPYQALPQPQVNFTASNQLGIFTTFTDSATQHPYGCIRLPLLKPIRWWASFR